MDSAPENVFAIPASASTLAGAKFFQQHGDDLTWAVGQETLARNLESLSGLMSSGLKRSKPPADGRVSPEEFSQAVEVTTSSIEHRATVARAIVTRNAATTNELTLCRYVDNFLSYVCDLIELALAASPGALIDSEATVALKDVFQHSDLTSLQAWLIERKINDLSFQGLPTIEEYYRKKFGFTLFPEVEARRTLTLAIASRNLIVHRRGIIDERFTRSAGPGWGAAGSRIAVAHKVWGELLPAILSAVRDIDGRAAIKFGLAEAPVEHRNEVAELESEYMSTLIRRVLGWSQR